MREAFLHAGLEMVQTMPAGGDRSERHDMAIERLKQIEEAAKVVEKMIAERSS